jgi:hypothetical protein
MSVQAVMARVAAIESRFGSAGSVRGTAVVGGFDAALTGAMKSETGIGPSSAPGPSSASFVDSILSEARERLGVPYVWGGTDEEAGLDCSGFVQGVFQDLGVQLPRVSRDQARAGREVASMAEARPGDLLFFNEPVSHVAIYLGDGQMIHAAGRGKDVRITDVYETPTHIRRIDPPATSGGARPAAGTSFDALFASEGAEHGVDPALLAAVARAESGLDPTAVSPAGAQGLMQLMPATAQGLGVADPFDPAQAVDGAARLLRSHLDRFGSVELALAAYNAGAGAVSRHGGVPPYSETQAYVRRVMDLYGASS